MHIIFKVLIIVVGFIPLCYTTYFINCSWVATRWQYVRVRIYWK
jgi:hypothetical protein